MIYTQGTRDYTGTTPTKSSYDTNFQSGTAVVSLGQSNGVPTIQGHGSGTAYNLALAPNAGGVGIGTTEVDARLSVRDDGTNQDIQVWKSLVGSTSGLRSLKLKSPATDDANAPFTFFTGNAYLFQVDGEDVLKINADKKVGIGTSNPTSLLELEQNGATQLRLTRTNAASNYCQIEAAGANSEQLKITTDPRGQGSGYIALENGGSEQARLDPNGRLLVGTSAYKPAGDTFNPSNLVYVENSGSSGFQTFVGISNRADNVGASIVLGKTRGSAVGSNTIVQNDDQLGTLRFVGADGVDRSPVAAAIECQVDGTPSDNNVPGSLIFSVTEDGNSTPTQALRIKNSRILNFVNTPTYADNAAAKAGGLVDGDVYRKSDGTLMIVYT